MHHHGIIYFYSFTIKEGDIADMKNEFLLKRISSNPGVCGGKPCIRDTRIEIAVILDGLAEGMTPAEIIDYYPQLSEDDIHAALAYAADLAHESVWKTATA
jgi:uncharacterized protein (DUF433 family)